MGGVCNKAVGKDPSTDLSVPVAFRAALLQHQLPEQPDGEVGNRRM